MYDMADGSEDVVLGRERTFASGQRKGERFARRDEAKFPSAWDVRRKMARIDDVSSLHFPMWKYSGLQWC